MEYLRGKPLVSFLEDIMTNLANKRDFSFLPQATILKSDHKIDQSVQQTRIH
jgi:hypothetical protein